MIIRKLDADHDWLFGKGLSNYCQTEQAIEENVKTRLLEWVGDCPFNLPAGIDWKSRLDVGQQAALISEIRALLLKCEGVIRVNSITSNLNRSTRADTLTYNIDTIFSSTVQNQLQLPGSGS